MASRFAPRVSYWAPYMGTLSCMRMLWNRASASWKTRVRRFWAMGAVTARSQMWKALPYRRAAALHLGLAQGIQGFGLQAGFIQQPLVHVGIVVGAVQRLLEAPVAQQEGRGGLLHGLELPQGGLDTPVHSQGTAPVTLQGQQTVGEVMGYVRIDIHPAVLDQGLEDVLLVAPRQAAPDELVDVVVATLGVGQHAGCARLADAEAVFLVHRPRIDRLAADGRGEGHVPVRHRELSTQRVGDVRVVADWVAVRNHLAELAHRDVDPGTVHDSAHPVRAALLQVVEEIGHVLVVEPLRGNPDANPFVVLGHHLRQPLQQVHQDRGPRVARIAARHEHVVQTRHAGEDLVPEFTLAFNLGFVRVIRLHDREPDPDIHVQLVADAGLHLQHVQVGNGEVGTVVQVVRARWNDLDGVGAEQRQIQDVAPELRLVPGTVGVGLVPVAQLVADQRVVRYGIDGDAVRSGPTRLRHVHLAQHAAHAKQHGTRLLPSTPMVSPSPEPVVRMR